MRIVYFISLILISQLFSVNAHSDDAMTVTIGDTEIHLNDNDLSEVISINTITRAEKKCNLNNLSAEDTKNGNGLIRITTDKEAIILFSSHRYILMDELKSCESGNIKLRSLPNSNITMLQDINFENKLFLQFSLVDKDSWLASISHFGSDINLVNAAGFNNPQRKKIDQGFSLGDSNGDGQISADGKYIVVNDFNCQEGKIPIGAGLWEIKSNKRVIFPTTKDEFGRIRNSDAVLEKCLAVFDGKSTIEKLGGKLGL